MPSWKDCCLVWGENLGSALNQSHRFACGGDGSSGLARVVGADFGLGGGFFSGHIGPALRVTAALRETAVLQDSISPEGRRVQTETGAIYIEEAGPASGPTLLLVHESVGWSRNWAEITPSLNSAGYRTIAMNLPPMGYSDRDPGEDYGRATQAKRIIALAKALGIKPIPIAHSFGAGPAVEPAMRILMPTGGWFWSVQQ